jgi:carbon-monoxide dehydrogenase small subunit
MKLTVNGVDHEIASAPLTPLLHVLRDELDVTSPKAGCQQGGCGTCTVLVDGQPRRSCLLAAAQVEGRAITTAEGLTPPGGLSPLQRAFHELGGVQCGFCTPGMIVAAHALLAETGRPVERGEVIEALGGHYCRCTGYVKIVEAVQTASRGAAAASRPAPASEEVRA